MSAKSANKSRTMFLQRSASSMELFSPYTEKTSLSSPSPITQTLVPSRSFTGEFPSYPQPNQPGEELIHYTHSRHPLAKVTLPDLFECSGCKEYGAGKRFTCQQCDFQLHDFCAQSPRLLKAHPLHGQHQIIFHAKPKQGGILWPRCDVCSKATKGFTFRCGACNFQMHPCCAIFSTEMNFPAHPHCLKLLPPMNLSNSDPAGFTCGECKRRRSGRVYRCTVCDYHLHAVCAKSMINGLRANGLTAPQKPNKIGTAARAASVIFMEFIEGLVEGVGESVGQAIGQNFTDGRSSDRRSTR